MSTLDHCYLKENLESVKSAIHAAEQVAGRKGKTRMIAAVKYADDRELVSLLKLGVTDVGENRVQQLLAHEPIYKEYPVTLHFIGHLQKNKVKQVVGKVALIHSVDSEALAAEIEKQAAAKDLTVAVLVEINSGREPDKSGVLPEGAEALCKAVAALPHVRLCGLMTMAPRSECPAAYLPYFSATRQLAISIWEKLKLPGTPLLSMGMSESFEPAIAEGADMVRVGRRLFAHDAPEQ